jgi:hypothetical protein
MNKKFILVFIVSLILLAGGFFYWQKMEKGVRGSSEDYIIREDSKGMFIENSRAGLVAKVPEGWGAEIMDVEEGWAIFNHPETQIKREEGKLISLPIDKGCFIEAIVEYKKMDLAEIKSNIINALIMLDTNSKDFSDVVIDGQQALKVVFNTDKVGNGISINIPRDNIVYIFNLTFNNDNKEECIKEFDNFLETVSIN